MGATDVNDPGSSGSVHASAEPSRRIRPGFGKRLAIAVLGAVSLALVLQVATADGPDAVSGGVGGDYASFYAAGGLALDDPGLDPRALYDPHAQFREQRSEEHT